MCKFISSDVIIGNFIIEAVERNNFSVEYDEDFTPMKAFVEPRIPDTVEPLTWEKVFPEFKSK